MKNTLLVTLEYPPMVGGVAHYYKNVVAHLPQDRIHVLDNSKNDLVMHKLFHWPSWFIGIWSTWRAVRTLNIEHILVGQILPIGTIALVLKTLFGTPYTVISHGMDITLPLSEDAPRRKHMLVRTILAHADSVVVASTYTQEVVERIGVSSRKITVVHPGLAAVGKASASKEKTSTPLILAVGRLVERKGFDRLIQAMPAVCKTIPNAKLVIVGEGEDRSRLEQLVKKHQLNDAVDLRGKVDDATLEKLYAQCALFVMPSRVLPNGDVEGFGIVFLEAAAHGKPTIGGRSGGITDAIVDGTTGYLVDPEDVSDITKRIVELLQNPATAHAMGEAGRKRVEENFQWSQQAHKIEALLQ